jgi:feruloyl esterase
MLEAQRIDRQYFQMDADDADLRAAQKAGVKMITQQSFADPGVTPQSAIHYRERAAKYVGGHDKLEEFSRLFLVPGQDHCIRGPGVAGSANPPMPTVEEWLDVLVDWVEKGKAPEQVIGHSVDNTVSRPICLYPKIAKYDGSGHVNKASSYTCEGEIHQ